MYRDRFYFLTKAKVELVQLSLKLAKPMPFTALYGLTCPNLVLAFLRRLGQLQRTLLVVLHGIGLTVPTFFRAYTHAPRKLLSFFSHSIYEVKIKRLGHKPKNNHKSIGYLGFRLGQG